MSSLSKGAYYYSEAHKIISTDPNQCAGCDQFTAMEEISLQMAESLLSRVDSEGMPVVWHNTDLQRS